MSPTFYTQHGISVLSFFLTLIFASSLIRSRRTPGGTLAWLLAIVLIPYVGIPLYLMLGGRKIKREAAGKEKIFPKLDPKNMKHLNGIEKILVCSGVPPKTSDNRITLFTDGVDVYQKLLAAIDGAERSIYVETFILGHGEVGRTILEHLQAKAAQGVEVKLLVDALGSLFKNHRAIKSFRAAGGQFATFMPLIHIPFRGRSNLRDHRKIVLIDERMALVGGMNLAHEYMGPTPDPQRWTDLALSIEGSSVAQVAKIFHSDWAYATKTRTLPDSAPPKDRAGSQSGGSTLQIVPSGPDITEDSLYDALLSTIFAAKERIWIATPYFIPDESLASALELACRRGVDVRLIIPARSNHLLADLSRGSYIRQIEAAGAKIFRFPQMVHAKANLIDHDLCMIGSANMDMRSLFLNFEVSVFLYGGPAQDDLEAWFNASFNKSQSAYTPLHFGIGTLEGLGRILGPML